MNSQVIEDVKTTAEDTLAGMGLDDLPVRVLDVQQRSLRDNGFLVDIDVKGVSQFYTSVDWHLDLGIPKSDERRTSGRLTPGRKCLVTDAGKFRSLETRARVNLEKYSHRVAMFGNYRYIPNTAFMEWYEKHEAITAEWDAAKQDLLDGYDGLVYEAEEAFTAMARETWLTLVGRNDSATREWVAQNSLAKFTEQVVSKARASMPSERDIEQKLVISLQPLATFLLGDEQAAIELERQRALDEAERIRQERDYWARSERAWAEEQEAKAEAARTEQYQRERVARAEADEAIRQARIQTEAIKQAQLEIARKAVIEMANPFEEVVQDLRANVYETVTEVLENIRKHGRVLGKTKEKIDNMVDLFRLMHNPAVTPDRELEQAIHSLETALRADGTETKRDTGAITEALNEVAGVTSRLATDLAAETRVSKGGWEQLDL